MRVVPVDERFFQGAVSFERADGWIKPWRLPFDKLRLFPPDEAIVPRGEMTAGVRVRLRTASAKVGLKLLPAEQHRLFDLVINDEIVQTAQVAPGAEEVVFERLPGDGERVVEIWLPTNPGAAVRGVIADDGDVEPIVDDRPRWVTYGSSITHCGTANSPARSWPATAARARGLNLTCLGYGGNCHMEPMIGLMIRDLPADVITLKLGINMHGGTTSPRTYAAGAIGLVRIIREKHPDIPIALISPIISPPRETTAGATGLTLEMMRELLADAVSRLKDCGDPNITCFDGRILFGPDLVADYLPDELHPNGDGYEIMGDNFAEKVLPELGF